MGTVKFGRSRFQAVIRKINGGQKVLFPKMPFFRKQTDVRPSINPTQCVWDHYAPQATSRTFWVKQVLSLFLFKVTSN